MHVRRVEVVLLVPGRCRQNDIGVKARRRHAEIEHGKKIELAFRRLLVPRDFLGFRPVRLA